MNPSVAPVLALSFLLPLAPNAGFWEQLAPESAQDSVRKSEDARPPDKNSNDPVDAFSEWARSIEPGPHHKHLNRQVGKWSLALKFIEPDGKSSDATGTSEFKAVLGGRYVTEETHTTLDGKPFEWLGWHGYDNVEKKHVADFIDNFGTNIDRMEGECHDDCKQINYLGVEKLVGGGVVKMRWVVRFESADKVVTEMYSDSGEGEKKSLEIVATRTK